MKYIYEAVIEPSGKWFEARIPDFDLITQGADMQEAIFMAQDILENCIVVTLQEGKELPTPTFCNARSLNGYHAALIVDCDENTPQDETMSVREASDILGVTPTRIRAMISSGILKSHKVGQIHMVDAQSVIDRFNKPVSSGRPRLKAMPA